VKKYCYKLRGGEILHRIKITINMIFY